MLDSVLKYDFPKDSSDPFDINSNDNYFVFANAYSNLSKDVNAFSFGVFEKYIPMGHKTIIICHRLLLINKEGKSINWAFTDNQILRSDPFSGKYFLTTDKLFNEFIPDWNRNIQTAVIKKPNTTDASLSSSVWDDFETCKKFALQNSLEVKCNLLISIIIDTISWH